MSDYEKLAPAIEALLFIAGDPLSIEELSEILETSSEEISKALVVIEQILSSDMRGIKLRYINNKPQLHSDERFSEKIEAYIRPERSKKLSKSMVETLSLIAYKQPITRSEIESIRGVRCEYTLNQLMKLDLVFESGRKPVLGRPALYATSDEFLKQFNINDLSELPNSDIFINNDQQPNAFEEVLSNNSVLIETLNEDIEE